MENSRGRGSDRKASITNEMLSEQITREFGQIRVKIAEMQVRQEFPGLDDATVRKMAVERVQAEKSAAEQIAYQYVPQTNQDKELAKSIIQETLKNTSSLSMIFSPSSKQEHLATVMAPASPKMSIPPGVKISIGMTMVGGLLVFLLVHLFSKTKEKKVDAPNNLGEKNKPPFLFSDNRKDKTNT